MNSKDAIYKIYRSNDAENHKLKIDGIIT